MHESIQYVAQEGVLLGVIVFVGWWTPSCLHVRINDRNDTIDTIAVVGESSSLICIHTEAPAT